MDLNISENWITDGYVLSYTSVQFTNLICSLVLTPSYLVRCCLDILVIVILGMSHFLFIRLPHAFHNVLGWGDQSQSAMLSYAGFIPSSRDYTLRQRVFLRARFGK